MSIYQEILEGIQTAVRALNLPGIPADQVQIGKLPAVEDELDTLPLLLIVPDDEGEDVEPASFENEDFITYKCELVATTKGKLLLAPEGNPDPNDDLFRRFDWREAVRKKFRKPSVLGVSQVWDIDIRMGEPVDRDQVNNNYDYSPLTILVTTQESY